MRGAEGQNSGDSAADDGASVFYWYGVEFCGFCWQQKGAQLYPLK